MFGFLKDKLKEVVGRFSKKVEESPDEVIEEKEPQKEEKSEVKKEEHKKTPEKPEKRGKKPEQKKEKKQKKQEKKKFEGGIPEEKEIPKKPEEPKEEKKGFFSKLFGKKEKLDEFEKAEEAKEKEKSEEKETEETKEAIEEEKRSEKQEKEEKSEEEKPEKIEEEKPEKKGFFSFIKEKITTKKISEEQFNEMFWDLELVLLESNVAVEVIEKIKEELKQKLVNIPIKKSEINSIIINSLRESLEDVLNTPKIDFIEKIKQKKPCVICFVGINGSGKTTTIAKVANLLQKNKLTCVIAAADTFRAAAIQQLEEHANNLNIKLIKHDYGSDSAAVAFDAIKHAEARHLDAVLIDTAGRLHSNEDLMKEMQKLIRVAKPDLKLFIGESITGNDCVEQAKKFDEAIGIDGIILAKADVDDKGGAAISISYVTGKPILFLGTGQGYDDLKEFDKDEVIRSLGL